MSEQAFFEEAPTTMFHRLQVWNWGPYVGHDFVFDAGIVDFVGENGSGKSSLIDAMRIALGLHHQNYLHKRRKKVDYARLNGPVAYVALTVHNKPRGLTRRMLGGKDRFKTIVAKIDKEASSGRQLQYKMFDGDLDLQEIVEAEKWRGPMSPKEYEQMWSRAGYTIQDRKNRVFDIATPDAVAKSSPPQLYELFTTFANNAEDTASLEESRRRLDKTREGLDHVTSLMRSAYSQLAAADVKLKEADKLVSLYETYEDERRQAMVREYEDAMDARKQAQKDLSRRAQEAAELRDEREGLMQAKATLSTEIERFTTEFNGRQENLKTQDARLKQVDENYEEASNAGNRAREERDRHAAFEKEGLPPTATLDEERTTINLDLVRIHKEIGARDYRVSVLNDRILNLEKHRVPLSIQLCVEELREEGVDIQPAWEFLPQDGDQILEDAFGRLRFGLIGQTADQGTALGIMRKHRYPGPFSTRKADEYAKMVAGTWKRVPDGFATPVGVFVEGATPPILNRDLVKSHLQELQKERVELERAIKRLEQEQRAKQERSDELVELRIKARERDDLQSRKHTWDDLIAEHDRLRTERDELRELQQKAVRLLEETKQRAQTRMDKMQETDDRIDKIDDLLLDSEASTLQELDEEVARTRRACEVFFDDFKDRASKLPVTTHQARADAAIEEIDGRDEPTSDAIKQLSDDVETRRKRYREHQGLREQKETDVQDAESNHKRLLAHRKAQLHAAYSRIKKTIEALAQRTGFEARLRLTEADGVGELFYTVDIRSLGRFEPLTSPKLSTGERLKGALVFLIGLTDPDDEAFYVFDEPGKHFGAENMQAMYTLFEHTKAQVLMTSTNEPEDPDGIRCRRFYMPQLVEERAPRTEKVLIAT